MQPVEPGLEGIAIRGILPAIGADAMPTTEGLPVRVGSDRHIAPDRPATEVVADLRFGTLPTPSAVEKFRRTPAAFTGRGMKFSSALFAVHGYFLPSRCVFDFLTQLR